MRRKKAYSARHAIRVTPQGDILGIFDDELPIAALGSAHVARLSQVDWDSHLQRWAIYDRVGRKWLSRNFETRSQALSYERTYMERRLSAIRRWLHL